MVLPSGDQAGSAPSAPRARLPVPSVFMTDSGPTPLLRSAGVEKTISLPSFGLKSAVKPPVPPGTAVSAPPVAGTVYSELVLVPSALLSSRVNTMVDPSGDHAGKVSNADPRSGAVGEVSRRNPVPS